MFWSSIPDPLVGGETSEPMVQVRRRCRESRQRLLEERRSLPTVPEFYAGRNVFLTGGSGFLGRLILEHLLRTSPDIGKLYIVMRPRRGVKPQDRLKTVLDVPMFDKVRAQYPDALNKIVVLPGDITELGLGLSEEHRDLLRREVSVIFNLAASVRFDDSFQKAVFTNLRSTRELVELARGMPQLRALVHVSTAYTNINRNTVEERVYTPDMDWRDVIRWAEQLAKPGYGHIDFLGSKLLGFQPNTYGFTKALAEKLIDDVSGELPVIITRPSIVIATCRDPIPGWIDNLYGLSGFWAGGFKGVMRVVYAKEDVNFDTIPADLATKTAVLASWSRGLNRKIVYAAMAEGARPDFDGVQVINSTIGNRIGISFSDMEWVVSMDGAGKIIPYPGVIRPPKFRRVTCKYWYIVQFWYHHILYGLLIDLLARAAGIKPRVLDIYRRATVAREATLPFTKEFLFLNQNQETLQIMMNPKDEANHCILDALRVRDTTEDFLELSVDSVRGILKYVLKEEDNPEKNLKAIDRMWWVTTAYHTIMSLLFFWIVYTLFQFKTPYQIRNE